MFLISLFQASTASLQFIWIKNRTRIYDVAWTKWLGASAIQERYQVTCSNSWLIFSAFSSVCYVFTSSKLPPCPFCSDFPLRPCDRFEFIGLAGHFTGDWAQTPSHSSRQLPMYTNVIFCCTGWLIGTLTMSYYNHLQSAYRHATIYGHDATEQTCYAIHVKGVSAKITCRYTSANKNKKEKKQTWSFTTLGRNVFNCFANWKTPNLQSDS